MASDNRLYLPTAGSKIKRKVTQMGKSSFGFALPKWWVQMYGLDKDGTVELRLVQGAKLTIGKEKPIIAGNDIIQIVVSPGAN